MSRRLTSIELCAGAGGQALGIERAGFEPLALVEIDEYCCRTLEANRVQWKGLIQQIDLKQFDARPYKDVDLLAAGLPCPPYSIAGNQIWDTGERNLFPDALRIIDECRPRAIMIESDRGILDAILEDRRRSLQAGLEAMGYDAAFQLFNASDFGVPQVRPRVVFVALREELWKHFSWPRAKGRKPPTVGEVLYPLMASGGWKGAEQWRDRADGLAPTIVGCSKKHGDPDLGPTRAKRAWETLSVNGHKLADDPPKRDFVGNPYLTVPMVALLQGFPGTWQFSGKKTHAYRQVGNAFPPPVAAAVARKIILALRRQEHPRLSSEGVD